jgi:hypothetical protein
MKRLQIENMKRLIELRDPLPSAPSRIEPGRYGSYQESGYRKL